MDDLISRKAVIDAVSLFFDKAYIEDADIHKNDMLYELNLVPTAERKGKWKEVQVVIGRGDFTTKEYKCEICGYRQYHHENFCGRCGARMEESDEYPD